MREAYVRGDIEPVDEVEGSQLQLFKMCALVSKSQWPKLIGWWNNSRWSTSGYAGSLCDTELGAKLVWSIGDRLTGSVRARGSLYGIY